MIRYMKTISSINLTWIVLGDDPFLLVIFGRDGLYPREHMVQDNQDGLIEACRCAYTTGQCMSRVSIVNYDPLRHDLTCPPPTVPFENIHRYGSLFSPGKSSRVNRPQVVIGSQSGSRPRLLHFRSAIRENINTLLATQEPRSKISGGIHYVNMYISESSEGLKFGPF